MLEGGLPASLAGLRGRVYVVVAQFLVVKQEIQDAFVVEGRVVAVGVELNFLRKRLYARVVAPHDQCCVIKLLVYSHQLLNVVLSILTELSWLIYDPRQLAGGLLAFEFHVDRGLFDVIEGAESLI